MTLATPVVGMYAGDETYANCKKGVWNPKGNDLFYQDLNIPVTLLFNKTDADFMYDHVRYTFSPHP